MILFFLASVRSFSPPAGYEPGLEYVLYGGEVLFNDVKETKIIQSVNFPKFKYLYDAISIKGSFCPQKTGNYRFRINGKSYAQLIINGQSYPHTLGPGGACLPGISTDITTEDIMMYEGRMYSIEIYLRTGCNLYSQWLYLYASFNGCDWYFPDTFVTKMVNECYPGLYGANCDNKCSDKCSEHGHCDEGIHGTGLCICDDGWEGDTCSDETFKPPLSCDLGAQWVQYGNEITFKEVVEIKNVSQIAFESLDITYDAVIVTGSIVPPRNGKYQFRMQAKPYGQLQIGGKFYPNSLGPAGSCLGVIKDDETTDVMYMWSNTTYPFTIKYRAGCGLYSKHLKLYWKNGPKMNGDIERAPWEFVPETAIYQCTEQECALGTFGENCQGSCPECEANSYCDYGRKGTGKCMCFPTFYDNGEGKCDACIEGNETHCGDNGKCYKGKCFCNDNYYGEHCERKCIAEETCNGHGKCSNNGQCVCDANYIGGDCKHKKEDIDQKECEFGVTYTKFSGEVLFDRVNEGPQTRSTVDLLFNQLLYNSATATGSVVVKDKAKYKFKIDAKPYGQLSIGGMTVPASLGPGGSCLPSIRTEYETDFMDLTPNKFYPFTMSYRSGCSLYSQHLRLLWKKEGDAEFTVIPNENLRACTDRNCSVSYYGKNCQLHCDLNCGEHGVCELYNGGKDMRCSCDENFYGDKCESYCLASKTCNGAGVCGVNGRCDCIDGFVGNNCTEKVSYQTDGNSMYCPKAVSALWHANENFGSITERKLFTTLYIPISKNVDYKSFTVTGSLSPSESGLYRFKAVGKPTVRFTITGFNSTNPSFDSGRCDDETSYGETDAQRMVVNKMYPFTMQTKTGCASYSKQIRLMYQKADEHGSFDKQKWLDIPIEMMRSCHSEECATGYYGPNCANKCGKCYNGVCSDGITGTGKCICDDWYTGDTCKIHTFSLAIAVFGAVFVVAVVWICWPSNDDEEEDFENENSTTVLEESLLGTTVSTPNIPVDPSGLIQSQRSTFDV